MLDKRLCIIWTMLALLIGHPSIGKSDFPGDEHWTGEFDSAGLDNQVRALATYNGSLIAGGMFSFSGTQELIGVGKWDGSTWQPLGTGIIGIVSALTEYDGDLIVGGFFSSAGSATVSNIAKWDGFEWSAFGNFNGPVSCFHVSEGKLFAGGCFEVVDGESCYYIAVWDGDNWGPLGQGVGWNVNAIQDYYGDIIVGGMFTYAGGGTQVNYIGRWDGAVWYSMGSGFNDGVHALTLFNGSLIAAGMFDQTYDGTEVHSIAEWNGSDWDPLGPGLILSRGGGVVSLQNSNGKLIAGGQFDYAGELWAQNIAIWDGDSWDRLGTGVVGSWIKALFEADGKIFVGGIFEEAGSLPSENIAAWTENLTQAESSYPTWTLLDCSPNPFSEYTSITFSAGSQATVRMDIYDISGRLVCNILSIHHVHGISTVRWDGKNQTGEDVASGIYFCVASVGGRRIANKITLAR